MAWQAGNYERFGEIRDRLMPLHQALFCETSPGPTKYALSRLDKCLADMRLPMVPISEASRARVDDAMRAVGLLN